MKSVRGKAAKDDSVQLLEKLLAPANVAAAAAAAAAAADAAAAAAAAAPACAGQRVL